MLNFGMNLITLELSQPSDRALSQLVDKGREELWDDVAEILLEVHYCSAPPSRLPF